ncbi:small ribosomal subunit protein mS23 [Phlebotomus argentipes]|uniref:small ribosomal subunit protein mS23 n=1 Tax=Phlebotomus argentipes TaxID=94469 RepID=UPI002892A77D|nr:small ribosomal subunit protein mS23 [Phlebotomus argentipes]
MAHSRLEKIGTIFTRTTGLLRTGAIKPEDKPLWYDIYQAFPPKEEPRYDRPAPKTEIRDIFYPEDVVRAKFHKFSKTQGMVTLSDTKNKTHCQTFIEIYNKLKEDGALSEEKILETAQIKLEEVIQEQKLNRGDSGLLSSFTEAKTRQERQESANVNITDIFKA